MPLGTRNGVAGLSRSAMRMKSADDRRRQLAAGGVRLPIGRGLS